MKSSTDRDMLRDLPEPSATRTTAAAELVDAAQLIADLKTLVDCGLIDIDEPFAGPARYRPAADSAEAM
jgi:hypothetical protein